MIVLYYAHNQQQDHVLRLSFLSTLLDEAFNYMHAHLCASVQGCKMFRMPFHRDVNLTTAQVRAMYACSKHCMDCGGVLFVAPEHRLSLKLKWHELRAAKQTELCAELDILDAMKYVDVMDESDEVLRYKYQLLYAVGTPQVLPEGQIRWRAVQVRTSSPVCPFLRKTHARMLCSRWCR